MRPQRTVQAYEWDLLVTQFNQGFKYQGLDVHEAWRAGIREWWLGLHSPLVDIMGPIKDALEWFWDTILKPPIEALFTGVETFIRGVMGVGGWIWRNIRSGIEWVVEGARSALDLAISGVKWVLSGISSVLNSVWSVVQNIGSTIWNAATSAVSRVWDWLVSVKDAAVGAIRTSIDFVSEKVTSGLGLIAGAFESVASAIWDALQTVASFILEGLRKAFEFFKGIGEWIFDGLKLMFSKLRELGMDVCHLITEELFGRTIKPETFRTEEFRKQIPLIKKSLEHSPQGILDWADAFLLPFIGSSAPEVMFEACGIDPEIFPKELKGLFGIMNMTADLAVLTGYIDIVGDVTHHIHIKHVGRFVDRIIRNSGIDKMVGFGLGTAFGTAIGPQLRYAINKQLMPMVPSMSALVRMEVREVWRPEFRAEQIEEAPSGEFYKWAAHQGYSKDHSDSFWAAHWELPTITQAYEMYHRLREGRVSSELLFTREDLLKLLRRQDILKRYRDQLIAVAYEVPTRREIRMMMEAGVIDHAEAENLYLDRGVDPKFAPMLADFAQARAQRDPLQGRWITSAMRHYREGYVDDAGFEELLAKREVPDDITEDSLEFAKLDQEYDYKSEVLRADRDLFKHGKLTEDEYRSKLREIGLSDERIDVYLERDKLHMSVREAELEEVPEPKTLTKSEILRLYRSGRRTEDWAREKLEEFTIATETIDDLLDLYSPEVAEVGGRSLSRAMLDRAFRDGIIDENYYLARMLGLGYTEEDAWIWYLVQIHGSAPTEEVVVG